MTSLEQAGRPTWLPLAFVLVSALGALSACSDGPNTQYVPIGSRCTHDSQCGTSPYTCETTNYPDGYCDKTCASDGDCPADAVCYLNHCRRTCTQLTDCRQAEGYTCRMSGATSDFCDIPEGS